MSLFKKKTNDVQEPMDLDAVMKKYDRESNTRIWEGTPKLIVTCILALFSVFCLYVTLFATWLDELRLTTFMAFIMLIGYLVFPAKKGVQKVNSLPWYDIILMVLGTGSFLYFACNAMTIVQRFNITTLEVVIGIIGVLTLAELCRRIRGSVPGPHRGAVCRIGRDDCLFCSVCITLVKVNLHRYLLCRHRYLYCHKKQQQRQHTYSNGFSFHVALPFNFLIYLFSCDVCS